MPRLLVTGSRSWHDRDVMERALIEAWSELSGAGPVVLVHGGARGADEMAEVFWQFAMLPIEVHRANWRPS